MQQYDGYPPIGPTVPGASPIGHSQPYQTPNEISFTSDFNNTVYLDVMALWQFGSGGGCNNACPVYQELLSLHLNTENYTKISNGSTAKPQCFPTSSTTCVQDYMNSYYLPNHGVSLLFPPSYTCYILTTDTSPFTGPYIPPDFATPGCNIVPAAKGYAPPPFIGMPDPFAYVEAQGSPDSYISPSVLASTYAPTSSPTGSGSGGGSYQYTTLNPNAPTLTINPTSTVLGNTVNVIATCASSAPPSEVCDVEMPLGTSDGSISGATCQATAAFTTNCIIDTSNPFYASANAFQFYAVDKGPTYTGNYATGNLLVAKSLVYTGNQVANVVSTAENSIAQAVSASFLTPTYLKSNLGGALLVPYNYTYSITQSYTLQGTSINYIGYSNVVVTSPVTVPAPFQLMLTFNPTSNGYSNAESPDLGNLRFYYGSSELYSWCESGCSSASSSATFWVTLTNQITAGQNNIITMYFLPAEGSVCPSCTYDTEYDGVYAGEAPQLSSTYGQYDNGQNVFSFYDNFAGNALNTNKWTALTNGGGPPPTVTVNNGLLFYPISGSQENANSFQSSLVSNFQAPLQIS